MQLRIITLLLFIFPAIGFSQEKNISIEQRLAILEDKMAIKNVIDEFSNLADTKEIDKQVLLFTEDGVVQTFSNGQQGTLLKGRDQLKNAFGNFLANFHTVYHQNGQQTIQLNGLQANATSYCRVILIGKQNGQEMKTTFYIIYKDELVKVKGSWFIKNRTSNFIHSEVAEVK